MEKLNLSTPWAIYHAQLLALFKKDKDVDVIFYNGVDEKVIKVYVDKQDKADALTKVLPKEKKFGNVSVKIEIIPANPESESPIEIFRKVFDGNDAVSYIASSSGIFEFNYIVFKKEVVQFYADNMSDPNGNISTLYEDIAREIFDVPVGVYFSTDTDHKN